VSAKNRKCKKESMDVKKTRAVGWTVGSERKWAKRAKANKIKVGGKADTGEKQRKSRKKVGKHSTKAKNGRPNQHSWGQQLEGGGYGSMESFRGGGEKKGSKKAALMNFLGSTSPVHNVLLLKRPRDKKKIGRKKVMTRKATRSSNGLSSVNEESTGEGKQREGTG